MMFGCTTVVPQKEADMDLNEYREKYSADDAAPGWDAIDSVLDKLYSGQEPKHYGTTIKYMLGGPDPIDGISIFDAGDHYHIVTYGFSSLYYDDESLNDDFSGFGFELTMRLPKSEDEPYWAMNMLQNIARYVFKSGKWFESGHYMPAHGPIRQEYDTELVGLAFTTDSQLGVINTVHGKVEFLQVFGITQTEIDKIMSIDKNALNTISKHQSINPLLVIDLDRGEI